MVFNDRLGIVPHIIRFCGKSKDKERIMNRLRLNDVQTESYLAILTQQSMIVQNNEKYVATTKGQDYLASYERFRKIVF
jgi:predicted transcriptional regulator